MKSHDSEPTPSKKNKRKGVTVSGNDASHKLFRYYYTIPKNKASKQPGFSGAASGNLSGNPCGTGTGAATAGAREDAADPTVDTGAGGAGYSVTDVFVHSEINWNVGELKGM